MRKKAELAKNNPIVFWDIHRKNSIYQKVYNSASSNCLDKQTTLPRQSNDPKQFILKMVDGDIEISEKELNLLKIHCQTIRNFVDDCPSFQEIALNLGNIHTVKNMQNILTVISFFKLKKEELDIKLDD